MIKYCIQYISVDVLHGSCIILSLSHLAFNFSNLLQKAFFVCFFKPVDLASIIRYSEWDWEPLTTFSPHWMDDGWFNCNVADFLRAVFIFADNIYIYRKLAKWERGSWQPDAAVNHRGELDWFLHTANQRGNWCSGRAKKPVLRACAEKKLAEQYVCRLWSSGTANFFFGTV